MVKSIDDEISFGKITSDDALTSFLPENKCL